MSLEFITEYYIPIVLAACLIVGYVIKKSLDIIPNKYIPLILAILELFWDAWQRVRLRWKRSYTGRSRALQVPDYTRRSQGL